VTNRPLVGPLSRVPRRDQPDYRTNATHRTRRGYKPYHQTTTRTHGYFVRVGYRKTTKAGARGERSSVMPGHGGASRCALPSDGSSRRAVPSRNAARLPDEVETALPNGAVFGFVSLAPPVIAAVLKCHR
jgi:hypothetical protein